MVYFWRSLARLDVFLQRHCSLVSTCSALHPFLLINVLPNNTIKSHTIITMNAAPQRKSRRPLPPVVSSVMDGWPVGTLVALGSVRTPAIHVDAVDVSDGAQRSFGLSPNALQATLVIAGVCCCVTMATPQVQIVAYCGDLGYGPGRGAVTGGCGSVPQLARTHTNND